MELLGTTKKPDTYLSPHHQLSPLNDLLASPGPTKLLRPTNGPVCRLFVLHTIPLRTPTPISPTPSTLSPSSSLSLLSLLRRRSHKRKVHPDGLVEQLLPMSAFDGVLSIRHCRVFDQHVALYDDVKVSPQYTGLSVFPSPGHILSSRPVILRQTTPTILHKPPKAQQRSSL